MDIAASRRTANFIAIYTKEICITMVNQQRKDEQTIMRILANARGAKLIQTFCRAFPELTEFYMESKMRKKMQEMNHWHQMTMIEVGYIPAERVMSY